MRPTFLGFQTAQRGMSANQKAMDIVGQNLTNINTEGYTRQRVDLVSMAVSGSNRLGSKSIPLAGQGVKVTGIGQVRDPFLDKRFREEYSDTAYYDTSARIIDDIESVFDEVQSKALSGALEKIYTSLSNLANRPDQATYASLLMNSAKAFSQTMQQFDTKLNNVLEQQKFNLEIDVADVNSILKRIADLNLSISGDIRASSNSSGINTYGPNELLDTRNLLLDQLSRYGEIRTEDRGDGNVNVTLNGHSLINKGDYDTLNMIKNDEGTITLNWQSTGSQLYVTSGSLKATRDMINGAGPNPTSQFENYEKGVPYYKDKLDALAKVFVTKFNQSVPQTNPPGTFKILFEPRNFGDITAENIRISDDWINDPSYVIKGVDADGTLNSDHLMKMLKMFSDDSDFGEFTGTFEKYVTFINTTIGQQKEFNTSRLSATSSIADELLNRRDAISAVSMDEEGTSLMMYNKAYNAIARVMTTMDEALDVLINRTGVVGR